MASFLTIKPTLIKVGSHRRVLARDVLTFQEVQRKARAEALD